MPLPMFLGTNLKIAGISILVTAILGGVAGGWWHIKKMTEVKTEYEMEINYIKAELWWREQVQAELSDKLAIRDKELDALTRTTKVMNDKIKEAKRDDKASASYLDVTVPDRMQQLTKDSICALLPNSCEPDGTDDR